MADEDDDGCATPESRFIREHRQAILDDWLRRVRETPHGKRMPEAVLRDHVPQLLLELAECCDDGTEPATAGLHALERFGDGLDLGSVMQELSLLRSAVFAVWAQQCPTMPTAALAELNAVIDRAVTIAAARYVDALEDQRSRTLANLESLLAASPVGIAFVDHDLRYVRINEALAAFNGRPAAEHLGHTVREMLPEMADMFEPMLRGVFETGQSVINLEMSRPDLTTGAPRWLLANYFPVRGDGAVWGVGAIVIDVSDTKRAERALQLEQARLHSIIEHAPAAIWVKDHEGRIVLANAQLADAMGCTLDQLVGRRSDEVLPPEFADAHKQHDERVFSEGRVIEAEENVPSPNGPRTFLSIKFPIPGEPPLVGAIATEITQRKQMEEELRIAVRTRENMMAIVSHDLRSPLATVQLSATLLLSQAGSDARAKRHLEMIHRACSRMEKLIADLLDTASIREGRLQITRTHQAIVEVAIEAVELQVPVALETGVAIVRSWDLAGVHVSCDRERIIQVFVNLLGNATKFCRAGDTITVRGHRVDDHVQFSIADTGPGIDPARLPRVFDAYWSAPEHTKHGSGLGLFIVRGIVESHGGRVWVESTPGHGATFFFTLPIAD